MQTILHNTGQHGYVIQQNKTHTRTHTRTCTRQRFTHTTSQRFLRRPLAQRHKDKNRKSFKVAEVKGRGVGGSDKGGDDWKGEAGKRTKEGGKEGRRMWEGRDEKRRRRVMTKGMLRRMEKMKGRTKRKGKGKRKE